MPPIIDWYIKQLTLFMEFIKVAFLAHNQNKKKKKY